MNTDFSAIVYEFEKDLDNIGSIVSAFDAPKKSNPRIRVAAANSATLLLAATFEEFVREMARSYAELIVNKTDKIERLPQQFRKTVWRRTMASLGQLRFGGQSTARLILQAKAKFDAVFEFCRGDLSQDIYEVLIHNENNMRASQINALFKISGLKDVCSLLAQREAIADELSLEESGEIHGAVLRRLDDFFNRRNDIAHSLNRRSSSGSVQINQDIELFRAIGKSLCETLEAKSQSS